MTRSWDYKSSSFSTSVNYFKVVSKRFDRHADTLKITMTFQRRKPHCSRNDDVELMSSHACRLCESARARETHLFRKLHKAIELYYLSSFKTSWIKTPCFLNILKGSGYTDTLSMVLKRRLGNFRTSDSSIRVLIAVTVKCTACHNFNKFSRPKLLTPDYNISPVYLKHTQAVGKTL